MRYRVTFMEHTNRMGARSEAPADYVAIEAPPGVVLEKNMKKRDQPLALHNEESLEEDDDFLSVESETSARNLQRSHNPRDKKRYATFC
jgi:hypothetical protein